MNPHSKIPMSGGFRPPIGWFGDRRPPLLAFKSSRLFSKGAGFTLIEVLVASAVLVLLTLLAAQIVQSGSQVVGGSRKHLNADSQAREVFSRFALDLGGMVKRPDMDVILSPNNDRLFFYSEAPGYTADTNNIGTISLVGYRIADARLERLGKALTWTNAVYLTYSTNTISTNSTPLSASTLEGVWGSVVGSSPSYDASDTNAYQLLADGVFRMAYCFQKKDGTYSLALPANPLKSKIAEVSSVILTLAILDGDSRKIISSATNLASVLPAPTQGDLDDGVLPGQRWQEALANTSSLTAAGIPKEAAGRIRIYQRSFPIPAP